MTNPDDRLTQATQHGAKIGQVLARRTQIALERFNERIAKAAHTLPSTPAALPPSRGSSSAVPSNRSLMRPLRVSSSSRCSTRPIGTSWSQ